MKQRLDVLLTQKGFFETREKAKANIIEGRVFVNGQKALKPGDNVDEDCEITVKKPECEFVSRGGYKLKKALDVFGIDVSGKVAADVGASTGGFSDCMLKRGLKKSYAIDVGYGQLDWKLRNDERVVVRERQNARYLTKDMFDEELDIVTIDVSFISLTLILPAVKELLKQSGIIVALIKPQFEAQKSKVGKKGVVRDAAVHEEVINKVSRICKKHFSFGCRS